MLHHLHFIVVGSVWLALLADVAGDKEAAENTDNEVHDCSNQECSELIHFFFLYVFDIRFDFKDL